jgi:molybdopterin molybdotransferase
MWTLEAAREKILASVGLLPAESVPLAEALGRVTAEPIAAPIDLPVFANSAMDGYAVRSADVASAGPAAPVLLRLADQVAAGERALQPVEPGACVRLFTGAPLPAGADAVVMRENTRPVPGGVAVLAASKPGEHVRPRGEDVARGAEVISAGVRLAPGHLSLLAALGLDCLQARRRPVVGLLATGSELVEPGQSLPPGKIYESNRLGLVWLLGRAGATAQVLPLAPDSLPATRAALEKGLTTGDALVTSGGVSVGELDFVKAAFEHLGGRLEFWQVAIKPGKPFVFGRWGDKLLFGLPGNPVSAWVTFLLLVRPALWRWQGAADIDLPTVPGVLAEPLTNPGERRHFLRVRMDGQGRVWSAGFQASHALSSLARANGLLDMPPGSTWPAGAPVGVLRWDLF